MKTIKLSDKDYIQLLSILKYAYKVYVSKQGEDAPAAQAIIRITREVKK